jgi:hypothetical protein
MEKGQLGTQTQRRFIFIWEGAVASLPAGRVVRDLEWIKRRMGLFDAAVKYWEVHSWCLATMWSLMARTDRRIDLCVTTRQPEFAKAVGRRAERENWPVRYVFCESPQGLGRLLPQMPDVDLVYYGLEEQRWAYGPSGYHITPYLLPDL